MDTNLKTYLEVDYQENRNEEYKNMNQKYKETRYWVKIYKV